MIGVLAVQALRAAGCANVIAIDPVESRLQMASESGRHGRAHVRRAAVSNADVVIECVGANDSVQTAIGCARKGGLGDTGRQLSRRRSNCRCRRW